MKRLLILLSLSFTIFHLSSSSIAAQNIVTDEGAWCWFADPRALHYENEAGTINATYLGYIDVHGNVKATQYDWLAKRKTEPSTTCKGTTSPLPPPEESTCETIASISNKLFQIP